MTLQVVRTNAPRGAEIRGLDLSEPLSPETAEAVRAAWRANPVLLVRGQKLSDAELMAFTRTFGELELPPRQLLRYSHGSGQKDDIPPEINWIMRVDGHTDTVPINTARFKSNWELSTARAVSVVNFLIEQGVPPRRLAAAGFGEYQPLDPANVPGARARNRRIELKLDQL